MKPSSRPFLQLINEILDLAKIEAGRLTVESETTDLFEILHALHAAFTQEASSKGLRLHLVIAPEVPQCIFTDAQKIQQILINLVSNAIKFTETGMVTVWVSIVETEQVSAEVDERSPLTDLPTPLSSVTLLFEVLDTGIGIASQDLALIFDAFAQTSVGQKVQGGTGLGLTISRQLAQMMESNITVHSILGHGSTFQFTLKVEIVSRANLPSPQPDRLVTGIASNQPQHRILVVDDQAGNRLLLVNLLERVGLAVQEAATGEEAIAIWRQWQPHLIWMDIRLPGINGYEVTRRIRALEDESELVSVIIAVTAQALKGDRALALAAGCDDYISKPFQEETLLSKMAEHLKIRYLYKEDHQILTNDESLLVKQSLTSEDLAVMPKEWLVALYQASLSCDQRAATCLQQQIPAEYESLTHQLEQLIQDFDFPQIIDLTEPHLNAK